MPYIFYLRAGRLSSSPKGGWASLAQKFCSRKIFERVTGVEPVSSPWQGLIIAAIRYPLSQSLRRANPLLLYSFVQNSPLNQFILWDRLESNQRPIGYASHYCFRNFFQICELDYPFTQTGCLPSSLYTFPSKTQGLGSGLSCDLQKVCRLDFPEFGRVSLGNYFPSSPSYSLHLVLLFRYEKNHNLYRVWQDIIRKATSVLFDAMQEPSSPIIPSATGSGTQKKNASLKAIWWKMLHLQLRQKPRRTYISSYRPEAKEFPT